MVENETININILERLILFLNSEYKNASKYLENKNADYLKLIKFQKEKDTEYENEINSLKQFKEKEQQNAINFRIEKQNLEDEIKEIKEKTEKIQRDYEKDSKTLKDQITLLLENLNNEKKKNHNLVEENKYKEAMIDEKEKSIAQLLNQMAEADTEIEHNEKLRKELTILQNDLFNTQKKLKQATNTEQEIKAKLVLIENNLNTSIIEKKQIMEELDKYKKDIDTIKRENEALLKEKTYSLNEFNDIKTKLNEKTNKIKYFEEKIVELSSNNTSSKASVESLNKKINDLENRIISLNKEKNETNLKFDNDIKSLKTLQAKELENIKANYEKENSILKKKYENDIENVKNNLNKQIETINIKNKNLDEKYANLPLFINNLFVFYEENDGMITINQTNMNTILERFNEIKTNFCLLESAIAEVSIDENSVINKNRLKLNKKLDESGDKEGDIIEKCKNFEKVKEKIESILARSDEILSKISLNFVNLDKVKKKLMKSNINLIIENNYTSANLSMMEDTLGLVEKMNFTLTKTKLNEFLNSLNTLQESFYFFFNIMIKVIKTSQDFTLFYINTKSQNSIRDKNQNLEIELSKKNENYLKNAIIALNQKLFDKVSMFISNNKELERCINTFTAFSSKNSNEISALEIYKFSNDLIEELMKEVNNFIEGKDTEIQNINEKIIYYLREINLIKNSEKDKSDNCNNIQIIKLQNQLKLKEEEIVRLNQRIEEHVKSIKALKTDLTDKSNNNITINKTSFAEKNLSPNERKSRVSKENIRENLKEKMNVYEEEINELKSQISEQKQNFQVMTI